MTERTNYSEDDEPEKWSEPTVVWFKASKVEASVSGPTKAVTKILPVVTGAVLLLGAAPVLLAGAGTAYVGWFIALAAIMALLGTWLIVLGTMRLRRRRNG